MNIFNKKKQKHLVYARTIQLITVKLTEGVSSHMKQIIAAKYQHTAQEMLTLSTKMVKIQKE